MFLSVLFFVSSVHNASAINYQCSVCPIGQYKSATSNNKCVLCPAATYQDTLGSTSATTCKPCPANSYAPAGSGRLVDCQCLAGHYSTVTGEDGLPCSACQAGKHKAQTGAVACTDCLANQYSGVPAATSNATCIPCTANAVSPVGSNTPMMCLCTTGFTGTNAIGCSGCTVGKFKATTGADACTDCRANTYSGLTAQKSNATCTPCYDNSISPAGSDHIDDCSCSAGFEFS
jgi:hypothetical protein